MSRDEGFAIMDVSVDIANDPKVRKLFRHAPDHAPAAFMAYVATMGESWRSGRRVNVDDAWPPALPFSKPAIEALVHVELLDPAGTIPTRTWRGWFVVAQRRRTKARDRWARYNTEHRGSRTNGDDGTTPLPRGSDDGTATSVPPVPPSRPSVDSPPTPAKRGLRSNGTNPRSVAAKAREERKRQAQAIRMDYYSGRITESVMTERLEALA